MSEPIHWQQLTPEQRNALVAEKVFGWQWIPAGRYGPHVKEGTSWLLPENGLSDIKSDLGADWISLEEALPYPLLGGNRFIPRNWIPRYTQSLDAAWLVIEHIVDQQNEAAVKLARWEENEMCFWCMRKDELCHEICIASLRACGYEVINERS